VPFLRDGRRALGDSTAIARAVEEAYPAPPLLPEGSDARARAWELERWFSEEPGRAIRLYMYGQIMAADPGRAAGFLLAPFPRIARVAGRFLAPRIERGLRAAYRIRPDTIEAAQVTIEGAFARIGELTGGDENAYLVGDRLSVADIAAASMLAPFVAPPGTPWVTSAGVPAIEALRDRLRGSAGYRWVEARYARDRGQTASLR
jgi:glutathione S-transferase